MKTVAVLVGIILFACIAEAQISKAVSDDSHVDADKNKYLRREAAVDRRDPVRT